MEQQQQQQPLLSGNDNGAESWRSYQYLERSTSLHIPTGEELVSGEEVRLASNFSGSDRFSAYPPSIHGALISSPEPPPLPFPHPPSHGGYSYQGGYNDCQSGYPSRPIGSGVLDEVEIWQLLISHVGHRCCWGSGPARRWKITSIEDCDVYVGTLETFIEERETVEEKEPYLGGKVDGADKGPLLGIWELDLRAHFPQLFIPDKEVKFKIPHSEAVHKCPDCNSRGETACASCNGKENQMTQCSACYGRGLIAHRDGSDTMCKNCSGKGILPCAVCISKGSVKCNTCEGHGSLLARSIAVVKWKTVSTKKVSASSGAASVPDEVFHKARGVQLCNMQAYQCNPAFFADSYHLNNFSSQVIASRAPVPLSARVITERHIISILPVTRVTMACRKSSFSFYIVGDSREIFIRDYPSRFCWGLCCCFEWLNV
ncbi:chaperone protein dnaJ-like protein isoform X2 [Carex rostrata]